MKTILVVILVLLCFELYGTDVEATVKNVNGVE